MTPEHILLRRLSFRGRNGTAYDIVPLTRVFAEQHVDELLQLHNLIPYQDADRDTFLAPQSAKGQEFAGKWALSLAVIQERQIIGFLTAYLRDVTPKHPMQAAYIHRLAVRADQQVNHVGASLTACAVALYFAALPWLLTVSVQTNDESANEHVLRFYRRLGFRHVFGVDYPHKHDALFEIERANHAQAKYALPTWGEIVVPAFTDDDIASYPNIFYAGLDDAPPRVYFITGSREKFQQYLHLARCYGFDLEHVRHTFRLTEPQVEGVGEYAEGELVAAPLKLFSRFAALEHLYPVMVEDTMLFVEHFNNDFSGNPTLPGADTKRWWHALGAEGLLRVMQHATARRARYVCQIGINSAPRIYTRHRAAVEGNIASSVRIHADAGQQFPYMNGTFFHRLFIPNGADLTLAEMLPEQFARFDYRRRCFAQAVATLATVKRPADQLALFGGT